MHEIIKIRKNNKNNKHRVTLLKIMVSNNFLSLILNSNIFVKHLLSLMKVVIDGLFREFP